MTEVCRTVAHGIREARDEFAKQNPGAVQPDGYLTVGLAPNEYLPTIESLDATITGEELEQAILYLERQGCFATSAPFIGKGNFGLWRISVRRLKHFT